MMGPLFALFALFVLALPFIFAASIGLAWVGNLLAKEKGRDVRKWTILGAIPGVNIFATLYFIGAINRKLESRLERIMLADEFR
jgi:hypothetical protein